jgi:GT2 family glycosyltransferase
MTANTEERGEAAPAVLVVVVNYNGGALLSRAVAAMKRQTFTDYRLVVVDNASSDDSLRLMQTDHPGVEVLRAGSNLGFAAANNLAVRRYSGSRWIALLNPDAFPEPDWLQNLVKAAQDRPDVAAFASRTVDARDAALLDGAGDAYHLSGRYWRRGHHCRAADHYLQRQEIFSACAAAALYARRAWDEVGGLDEEFFCYGEDIDLGFRLQLAGYKCLYVADAVAAHYGSAVTGERSRFSTYHGQRNLVWVYVKNMPPALFWLLLPCHLLMNIAALIGCALRGQAGVALQAKFDAMRGLGRNWAKRRSIQRARKVAAPDIAKLLECGWPGPRC